MTHYCKSPMCPFSMCAICCATSPSELNRWYSCHFLPSLSRKHWYVCSFLMVDAMNAVGLPLPSPGELKQVHEDKSAALRMWGYSSIETYTCRSLEGGGGGGGLAAHMIGTQHANQSVFSKLKLKHKTHRDEFKTQFPLCGRAK